MCTQPETSTPLHRLNAMSPTEALDALHAVCGSRRWTQAMEQARPFGTPAALLVCAEQTWRGLPHPDWLEAFDHHPRIGDQTPDPHRFGATLEQSAREQSGMGTANDEARAEFRRLNANYEQRFGHVFLICASGNSAEFMLGQIKARLLNTPEVETRNAADQQAKIIRLRLERMLGL